MKDEEIESLDGKLTYQDATKALSRMKNNKSPGPYGLTAEFFKVFYKYVGMLYVRSVNEGFSNGKLSFTKYQAVITCSPREGKPKQFLKKQEAYLFVKCKL